MNETDFQRKLNHHFDRLGWDLDKIHGNMYQQSGLPDLIGVMKGGRAIYIECKFIELPVRDDSKVNVIISKLQLYTLKQKSRVGALALVAVGLVINKQLICMFFKPSAKFLDSGISWSKKDVVDWIEQCKHNRQQRILSNNVIFL